MRNLFTVRLGGPAPSVYTFGVAGAGLWRFLGAYYDALPDENDERQQRRRFNQHFASLERPYLPEPEVDVDALFIAFLNLDGRDYRHRFNSRNRNDRDYAQITVEKSPANCPTVRRVPLGQ